jgi:Na+-translocating ferredoxin:NAD+ oxidoreductase RNF subunit RnfB
MKSNNLWYNYYMNKYNIILFVFLLLFTGCATTGVNYSIIVYGRTTCYNTTQTLSTLGFLFGLLLAIFAKIFHVKEDPKVLKLDEILPGINCGACGYPGCSGYSRALIADDVEINLCAPGGKDTADKIGKVLGKSADSKEKMTAKIFCIGDISKVIKDYQFNGQEDCSVVYSFFQGDKGCKDGCMGRGNCIRVCPVNAIVRDSYNRVVVDEELCIGCERCVTSCPTAIIKMIPAKTKYFVACSNKDKGGIVRKLCLSGCIACRICEKIEGVDKISVTDNLATVNYKANSNIKQGSEKCPPKVIIPVHKQLKYMNSHPAKAVVKKKN